MSSGTVISTTSAAAAASAADTARVAEPIVRAAACAEFRRPPPTATTFHPARAHSTPSAVPTLPGPMIETSIASKHSCETRTRSIGRISGAKPANKGICL